MKNNHRKFLVTAIGGAVAYYSLRFSLSEDYEVKIPTNLNIINFRELPSLSSFQFSLFIFPTGGVVKL